MSPEQLSALSGVVAATNSTTPGEAVRMAQIQVEREQARRGAEVDKDRRHQLDLLNLQNDVNKAALSTQSQLGIGVAGGAAGIARQAPSQRTCPNGHRARPEDKLCAQCGAAI
jgi:hypothetical protein